LDAKQIDIFINGVVDFEEKSRILENLNKDFQKYSN